MAIPYRKIYLIHHVHGWIIQWFHEKSMDGSRLGGFQHEESGIWKTLASENRPNIEFSDGVGTVGP